MKDNSPSGRKGAGSRMERELVSDLAVVLLNLQFCRVSPFGAKCISLREAL